MLQKPLGARLAMIYLEYKSDNSWNKLSFVIHVYTCHVYECIPACMWAWAHEYIVLCLCAYMCIYTVPLYCARVGISYCEFPPALMQCHQVFAGPNRHLHKVAECMCLAYN